MLVVQDGPNLERLVAILAHIPFVFAMFGDIFVAAVWADPDPQPAVPSGTSVIFSSINSAIGDSSGPSPASCCFWAVLRTMGVWRILFYSFLSVDNGTVIPNIRHMNENRKVSSTPDCAI